MKIKIILLLMATAFLAFFLIALPLSCTKSTEKETSNTQTEQVTQEETKVLPNEPAESTTIAENTAVASENRSVEPDKKSEPITTVPAPKPVEEKKTSVKTPTQKPTEKLPVAKETQTKTTPVPTVKTESPKSVEPPKPEQPVPVPESVNPPEPPVSKLEKVVESTAPPSEKPVAPVETKPTSPQSVPQANNWPVPESANKKINPVKADNASINLGKALWKKHCASCHGKSGLGDGSKAAQLDTPCGDFTLLAFQNQTDGALFYKTVEGRDDMPGYKKKIPDEEDIWHLVNFMRTMK